MRRTVFALVLLVGGCATGPPAKHGVAALPASTETWQGPKATVAVTGIERATDMEGPEWADLRVGMGVSSLLAQALQDTGRFVLVETTPEVRAEMARRWTAAGAPGTAAAPAVASEYGASACVERFRVRDVSAFLGLAGAGRKATTVAVAVVLRNVKTGQSTRAVGRGRAVTGNAGVLFVTEAGTVGFDETTVGKATKAAIHDAVSRIVVP
jgi:curli biogenesis system outer membrane secretion channel CsgG